MPSGHTPLIALSELGPDLYAKIEYLHPSGSIKHRAIPGLIEARKNAGIIKPGQCIAVLSAGAAAVSVAWVAARLGHPALGVLPRTAPRQILRLLRWMGADHDQIDADDLEAVIGRLQADPKVYVLSQTSDREMVDYYRPVATEILEQLPQAAAITAGIGTGATITGIGRELRRVGSRCRLVGVEPAEASVASGRPWAPHTLTGLAPPIAQPLLDREAFAEILPIASEEAWRTAQRVHRQSGLPIGPSSGAAVAAAQALRARGFEGAVVAVCPCSIAEYLDGASAR